MEDTLIEGIDYYFNDIKKKFENKINELFSWYFKTRLDSFEEQLTKIKN